MKTLGLFSLAFAALVALASPAEAQSYEDPIEAFEATTVQMDVGRMTVVRIGVTAWSTEDERTAMIEAFQKGGSPALGQFLHGQTEKGFVKFPDASAYQMHYAYQFEKDGKRIIVMATDRPIRAFSWAAGSKALEKNLSILKLVVDADTGKGEGVMAAGAELVVNDKRQLEVETPGTQPIRFTSVKQLHEKKKKKK
jgi:hypothetical protein